MTREARIDPVSSILSFVQTFEDPLHGVPFTGKISPEEESILYRARQFSEKSRLSILSGPSMAGFSSELGSLSSFLSTIGSGISSVVSKVGTVLKSPALPNLAGLIANFVPKSGSTVGTFLSAFSQLHPAGAAQAAATSQATAQAFPQYAGDSAQLLGFLPPNVLDMVKGLVGQIFPSVQGQGGDWLTTALKGIGQFVAIQRMAKGSGAPPVGGSEYGPLADIVGRLGPPPVQNAIQAGIGDLLLASSLDRRSGAVQTAIEKGAPSSEFPVVPVVIGGAAFMMFMMVLVTLSARRG